MVAVLERGDPAYLLSILNELLVLLALNEVWFGLLPMRVKIVLQLGAKSGDLTCISLNLDCALDGPILLKEAGQLLAWDQLMLLLPNLLLTVSGCVLCCLLESLVDGVDQIERLLLSVGQVLSLGQVTLRL